MSALRPFHIAVPVDDLAAAREFYGGLLGCREGRSADRWIDFDLFGHQFVCHLQPSTDRHSGASNPIDGHDVPLPHFGVVLDMDDWQRLADRLESAGLEFVIAPYARFRGQTGEQGTLFIRDPAGNALEFKGFRDLDQLFAK
ncbi:MAG: glyoxalase [Gammaproteobacteria bacterium]|nr:VOC family protein [Gammaproteobacteria bacterium]NND37767.1 glyoxalase [Gammaproteobacteria bacterium]